MIGLSREENLHRFIDEHRPQLPWLIAQSEALERDLERRLATVRSDLTIYRERAAQGEAAG